MLGALHLQLLQDQAFQHLLAEHVLRRHFLLGFLETICNSRDLLVELALEHHALDARFARDRGSHAIEQLPGGRSARASGNARREASMSAGTSAKRSRFITEFYLDQRFVSGRS